MKRGGGDDGASPDGDSRSAECSPAVGEFHRLLSAASRRRVLYYLQEHRSASMRELCDALAGWQAVADGGVIGPAERRRIETELHHADLPRLADGDVVTYDQRCRTVSMESLPTPFREIIRRTRRYEAAADPDGARETDRDGDRGAADRSS